MCSLHEGDTRRAAINHISSEFNANFEVIYKGDPYARIREHGYRRVPMRIRGPPLFTDLFFKISY